MYRAETESQAEIAASFIDWGISTADSIIMVKESAPNTPIIASGGLRSGVDIAKTIALGASLGGMAGPFIKAANVSSEKVSEVIETVSKQLQISMFAAGVRDIPQLKEKTGPRWAAWYSAPQGLPLPYPWARHQRPACWLLLLPLPFQKR